MEKFGPAGANHIDRPDGRHGQIPPGSASVTAHTSDDNIIWFFVYYLK